jgi:hydrogenase-1 operon protein HyaE
MSISGLAGHLARGGIPILDETAAEAFLDATPHGLLLFPGDPALHAESLDVAVILPELLAAFAGRYRAAALSPQAEAGLKARFGVLLLPSLVVTRRRSVLGVLPRLLDWNVYLQRLGGFLAPASAEVEA